jgi:2-methylaconitate cis-trans-isomerase PrpF
MSQQTRIPCVVMRGGTSKGLFFHQKDLPDERVHWDAILLAAFGSPDPRQIDGLGGSYSTTSKAAIIRPSSRPNVDIDYTFGQVSVDAALVDYRGNCGNISSAVGPFAIDEGLVEITEPVTCVRILNTNTGKIIEAEVQVENGQAAVEGNCHIAGVPGTGSPIRMGFIEPSGSVTKKLLPTGRPIEVLRVPGVGDIEASLVDAGNPAIFVRAADVGMTARESAEDIDGQPELVHRLEAVRSAATVVLGFVDDITRATTESPAVPKMTMVAPPSSYQTAQGEWVEKESIDVTARIMSMQRAHRAFAITGSIATTAAAVIPGTIVSEASKDIVQQTGQLRLGHPAGTMCIEVTATQNSEQTHIHKIVVERTARRLMEGFVLVPNHV